MESKTLDELLNLLPEFITGTLAENHELYPGDQVGYSLSITRVNGLWKISYDHQGWEGVDDVLPHYTPISDEDQELLNDMGPDLERCGCSDPDLKAAVIKMLVWLENYGH